MSLGSTTGSTVNADSDIVDAIKRARAKGVSVLILQEIAIALEMVTQDLLLKIQIMVWSETHQR